MSCITQKFTLKSEISDSFKVRQLFLSIDIIFEPVKHKSIKINCYFFTQKHLAYRGTYEEPDTVKHSRTFECYYCSNYHLKKVEYEKHICSELPGVLYNSTKQNLVSFEEHVKDKGDLPFVTYCDFEKTTTNDCSVDPENNEMFPV